MGWLKHLAFGLTALALNNNVVAQNDGDIDLPDAPSSKMPWPDPPFVWDPVHDTCNGIGEILGLGSDTEAQNKLMNEVVLMANNALTKMDNLEKNAEDAWYRYQTKTAFNLIFNIRLPDAEGRWSSVKSSLQAMTNLASLRYIYMMCDDSPTGGEIDPDTGGYLYTAPHDSSISWVRDSKADGLCATKPGQIAYRFSWIGQWDENRPQYVVICGKQNSGDVLVEKVAEKVTAGSALDDHVTLTHYLFHEFLHVTVPNMRGDDTGGTAEGGERYMLQGALEVRDTYGPLNPDSVALFALAVALDDWIWLDGKAESKEAHLERAKGSPEGRQILRDWGFPGGDEPPEEDMDIDDGIE